MSQIYSPAAPRPRRAWPVRQARDWPQGLSHVQPCPTPSQSSGGSPGTNQSSGLIHVLAHPIIPFMPPMRFIIFIRPPPFIFFIMPCICSN